jgi:LacI family transcriptional regulator
MKSLAPATWPAALAMAGAGRSPALPKATSGAIVAGPIEVRRRPHRMTPPKRITIKDIAHAAGLSTAAVSHALRPHPGSNIKLQQETIERVRRIAAQLHYQPHSGARSIRSNRFHVIGYFAAKTGNTSVSPSGYMAGVHDTAEARDFRMNLIRLPRTLEDIDAAMPSVFRERNLDALVIESYNELAYQIYERIRATRLPVVFVNDRHETNSVYVDDEWGAAELTRHLIAKGYQRIGFLQRHTADGPPVEKMHHSALDREIGYRKAMREARLKPSCHTLQTRGVALADDEIHDADWNLIASHDAIIAYDDDLANLVARAAYDRGVPIPGKLALAGFNGDYASVSAWRNLTTMRIPSYEMGTAAAEMVFRLVQAGGREELPSSVHRPTLIPGKTS